MVRVHEVAGSNPVTPTSVSVHKGTHIFISVINIPTKRITTIAKFGAIVVIYKYL